MMVASGSSSSAIDSSHLQAAAPLQQRLRCQMPLLFGSDPSCERHLLLGTVQHAFVARCWRTIAAARPQEKDFLFPSGDCLGIAPIDRPCVEAKLLTVKIIIPLPVRVTALEATWEVPYAMLYIFYI